MGNEERKRYSARECCKVTVTNNADLFKKMYPSGLNVTFMKSKQLQAVGLKSLCCTYVEKICFKMIK